MGFGHRVYKIGDSSVPTMESAFRELAKDHGRHAGVTVLVDAVTKAHHQFLVLELIEGPFLRS